MDLEIDDIYSFKMNSGEEIVARVVGKSAQIIEVESPVSVAPSPQGIGLVPTFFTAQPRSKMQLNINSISLTAITDDNVRTKYIEATTGLRVPEKKLVLG